MLSTADDSWYTVRWLLILSWLSTSGADFSLLHPPLAFICRLVHGTCTATHYHCVCVFCPIGGMSLTPRSRQHLIRVQMSLTFTFSIIVVTVAVINSNWLVHVLLLASIQSSRCLTGSRAAVLLCPEPPQ